MSEPERAATDPESAARALYQRLLDGWNARDGEGMAAPFAEDGVVIGFDGSLITGRAAIATEMSTIFADHLTPTYIALVRDVRALTLECAILRADAGLLPRDQTDLNPALNARQALVAVNRAGAWRVALFQSTPAQLHGRPDLAEALTADLRAELARRQHAAPDAE